MILTTTFWLAALFAVMLIALSMLVSLKRRQLQVAYGDGKDDTLRRRIRAHGNFTENAPMLLILTGALELGRATDWVIVIIALMFAVARLLQAFGALYGKTATLRAAGMITQHTATAIAALFLILLATSA